MKNKITKILLAVLVFFASAFLFSCEINVGENTGRVDAKAAVKDFLSNDLLPEIVNNVALNKVTSNITFADPEIEPTEEDLENNSYSGFIRGVTAYIETSRPDVIHAEWVSTAQREYVKDDKGTVIGVQKTEQKHLVLIVDRQEEDVEVEITVHAEAPYAVGTKTHYFSSSRTITVTVAAKEPAFEMTLGELMNLASSDWVYFQQHGVVDAEGNEKCTITVRGIVTEELWGDGYDNHSFMINDGEASLYVYAPTGDTVEIGDLVEVTCVPTTYYGIVETSQKPVVKVLYGGQAVPAPKATYTVDELYENVSLEDHTVAGQRYNIQGVLAYESGNFVLKSDSTDKFVQIYYKAYTDYEKSLLNAQLGNKIELETCIYDSHSAGYLRLLPNVYDYPIKTLEMTDKEKVDSAKLQLQAAQFKAKYEDGDELVLPTVTTEGVQVTWSFEPASAYADGKIVAKAEGTLKLTAVIAVGAESDTFEKVINIAPKAGEITKELVENPVAGTEYVLFINQVQLNKELYFTGEKAGNFLATSEELASAAKVVLEAAEGGFYISFIDKNGAKKYIDVDEYQAGKFGVAITDAPSCVYTWDATVMTFNTTKGDSYLGSYNQNTSISRSALSYITGDNAANIDVTQYPVRLYKVTGGEEPIVEPEPTIVSQPVAGEKYHLVIDQKLAEKEVYFKGEMSGNYLATTEDKAEAVAVLVEAVEGGFRLSFETEAGKQYIDLYEFQTGKVGVRITGEPTAVFTWDETTKTFFAEVIEGQQHYLGCYKTYVTVSASSTSYITGDNAANVDVTQFPLRLLTIAGEEPQPEPTELTVAEALAKAAQECPESGNVTAETYTVKGIVVDAGEDKGTYVKNLYIADALDSEVKFLVYSVSWNDDVKEVAVGDTVVVKGYVKNYNGTIEMATANSVFVEFISRTPKEEPQPEPTELTVAEALAKATQECPESGNVTAEMYTVKGIVVDAGEDKGTYVKNLYIADALDSEVKFLVYSVSWNDDVKEVAVGDTVVVKGYVKNYNGTIEMATANSVFVEFISRTPKEEPQPEPTELTVAEALAKAAQECPESGNVTADLYLVKGYVVDAGENKGNYAKNVYIADSLDSEVKFLIYSINFTEAVAEIAVGDMVVVKGYIKNYNGTIEMASANNVYAEFVSRVAGEQPEPEPELAELLVLDFEESQTDSDYNDAHWTQQKYTTQWEVMSGQMRSRGKDGTRVVNMAAGYSMTNKYTYTADELIKGVQKVEFKLGNYWTGAQVMPIKVVLVLSDNTVYYLLGSTDEFYQLAVTTGLEQFSFEMEAKDVKGIYFVNKSAISGSAFLYLDDVKFLGLEAEEPEPEPEFLTVAAALEKATKECPNNGNMTAEMYTIKGVIVDAGENKGNYVKNLYIADAYGAELRFLVYSINFTDAVAEIGLGDTVVVKGYVKNYNGTIEMATGNSVYPIFVSRIPADASLDVVAPTISLDAEVQAAFAQMELFEGESLVDLFTQLRAAISIIDDVDGPIEVQDSMLDLGGLNLKNPVAGKYTVSVTASDAAGNTQRFELPVTIKSNNPEPTDSVTISLVSDKSAAIDANGIQALFGSDLVTEVSGVVNVYAGYNNYLALGMKFGTSSANGEMTLKLAKKVTSIDVVACGWKDSDYLSVNGIAKDAFGKPYTDADALKTLTFEFETATDTLVFLFAKRGYIQSVTLHFEESGEPNPEPTDDVPPTIDIDQEALKAFAGNSFIEGVPLVDAFALLKAAITITDNVDGEIELLDTMINFDGLNIENPEVGEYNVSISLSDAAGNPSTLTLKITIKPAPEYYNALVLDFEESQKDSDYNDAHWTQQYFNGTDWVNVSGQMRSRGKDGTRVVNMYSANNTLFRYTYTADAVVEKVQKVQVKLGNYFSGAQKAPMKLVLVLEDDSLVYSLGGAEVYCEIDPTPGLIFIEFTLSRLANVKGFFIEFCSPASSAYLYLDDFTLIAEKPQEQGEPEEKQPVVVSFADNDKGTSEINADTIASLFDSSIIESVSGVSKVYGGYNNFKNLGLKFGTSSANGKMTLKLTQKVTKITVVACGWTASDYMSVNGENAPAFGKAYTEEGALKTMTLTFAEPTDTLVFEFVKRGFIQSLSLYFE